MKSGHSLFRSQPNHTPTQAVQLYLTEENVICSSLDSTKINPHVLLVNRWQIYKVQKSS